VARSSSVQSAAVIDKAQRDFNRKLVESPLSSYG